MSLREELLPLYRQMQLIRRIEEESARAYVQGKIGGFLHLYIGQEAIAVATEASITKRDAVITTYRDHGFALAEDVILHRIRLRYEALADGRTAADVLQEMLREMGGRPSRNGVATGEAPARS